MASVIPISKVSSQVTQQELSEYCLMKRNLTEARLEVRMAREVIVQKLRSGSSVEDGILLPALISTKHRGKKVERLLVGC